MDGEIRIGNSLLDSIYIGNTKLDSVYVGNTKIWPSAALGFRVKQFFMQMDEETGNRVNNDADLYNSIKDVWGTPDDPVLITNGTGFQGQMVPTFSGKMYATDRQGGVIYGKLYLCVEPTDLYVSAKPTAEFIALPTLVWQIKTLRDMFHFDQIGVETDSSRFPAGPFPEGKVKGCGTANIANNTASVATRRIYIYGRVSTEKIGTAVGPNNNVLVLDRHGWDVSGGGSATGKLTNWEKGMSLYHGSTPAFDIATNGIKRSRYGWGEPTSAYGDTWGLYYDADETGIGTFPKDGNGMLYNGVVPTKYIYYYY